MPHPQRNLRGYNITNQGRSHELLAIKEYSPILTELLREASELCAAIIRRPVDLVRRVREQPCSLWTCRARHLTFYLERFHLDARQRLPDDTDWTVAEIRSCCRLATLLDVPLVAAAQNVVPVARRAGEAGRSGRDLPADWRVGHYTDERYPVIRR